MFDTELGAKRLTQYEMKNAAEYEAKFKIVNKKMAYIPIHHISAFLIAVLQITLVLETVVALCVYLPYFYIAASIIEFFCVVNITASDDNPDYKIPWLLFVLVIPIVGVALYFAFYSKKLKKKYVNRLDGLKKFSCDTDDGFVFDNLKNINPLAASHADMLCKISGSHLFADTDQTYFSVGENMFESMLVDIEKAEKFIYLEYFIIEEGKMWNSVLQILRRKAESGVDVKLVYDDIGCMVTLPEDYYKTLKKYGIDATPFFRFKGGAGGEFNNRNHRKILIVDGYVGYTGGINLADEYINAKEMRGYWKDGGIRLEGNAVRGLTELFFMDFGINVKKFPEINYDPYPKSKIERAGYVIPFGDGPRPLYNRNVAKSVIRNMLDSSTRYVYITTPYLIIDNELCSSIENAAIRGVDVKILLPHIPDKKTVFDITRSFYSRLMDAGVNIYEYKSGFMHAKNFISDDVCAMVGTVNLDYRSLVHHFENGVWMYGTDCIKDIKADIDETLEKCLMVDRDMVKVGTFKKIKRSVIRIFAPLL